MKKRMIVDVQNHVVPLEVLGPAINSGILDGSSGFIAVRWRGISWVTAQDSVDVDRHIQVCLEAGLTHIMLHMGMLITLVNELSGMSTIDVAKAHNDCMAQIRDKYPNNVFPYGMLKPHDGKCAIKEAERCINELHFKALAIDTSYGTTDHVFNHVPETYEFWEYVNDKNIPVYMHPAFLCYGWEWMDRYKFEETVGRPAETALSVSLMIMSGLFDRFPDLRIILAHMGGGFTMCLPRLRFGHRLGYDGFLEYQKAKNKKDPIEYVRNNLWVDTMGFDPAGIKHAIELYGIDHVLLGTDYGPVPISPREHIDIVCNDLGLAEEDQDKILGLNAKKL
ncbi:MAG: amidohydrolase family protein, partial [Dehalococcoidia bacterium]|nr:amidohydrolase family protein [Dehalococcoidia bacterium]